MSESVLFEQRICVYAESEYTKLGEIRPGIRREKANTQWAFYPSTIEFPMTKDELFDIAEKLKELNQ